MATITKVVTTCDRKRHKSDVPGREVKFSIDGVNYKVFLCNDDEQAFLLKLGPFIEIAQIDRHERGRHAQSRPRRSVARRMHSASVRAWAKREGIDLADRGRIPAAVVARYEASRA